MTNQTSLDERYGRRPADPARTTRRALLGVGALFVVVALFFTWFRTSRPRLDFVVSGYTVTSDRAVDVRFSITKEVGIAAVCRVVAQNRYQEVIGTIDVTVPGGPGSERTQLSAQVPTRERAVVGTVQSCRVSG